MSEIDLDIELKSIKSQVKRNPLSKEDSKKQFVELTNKLDLKHSFDFEEAWEVAQELRKRKEYRNKVLKFEEEIKNIDGVLVGKDLHKANPTKHAFADGCYIREIFNPAGEIIVTKIHKKEHPFFLMKGKMTILTEKGFEYREAPYHGITYPGTKRVIYTHTDCVFITVHVTKETDLEKIEKEIISEDFNKINKSN
tara:strand:- start:14321 stop:14908 length:588 start_codon:yes stop_codon:yes gene_type:complete